MAAIYAREIEHSDANAFPIAAARPARDPAMVIDGIYAPIQPALDLATSPILAARGEGAPAPQPASAEALRIGGGLSRVAAATQRTTLAGFRLLDANGVAIGGGGDIGLSFAHLAEVREAISGRFSAVMRVRDERAPTPPIYSISRGAKIRVFVAVPVFVEDRVRGIVYLSRTPDNILRNLYRERGKVAASLALVLIAAIGTGAMFVRTIARPVRELAARAEAIFKGRIDAIGPLAWHGTSEVASLTRSFMNMARKLSDRSDYLSGFANHVSHELKTPLTAIKGAAELMRDADTSMSAEQREKFLSNVLADTDRISVLLDRLRDLARADNPGLGGQTELAPVIAALRGQFPELEISLDLALEGDAAAVAISAENAQIVFGHLIDNAGRHGATRVRIETRREGELLCVKLSDDGAGISSGNRERVFDPFFTTRRAQGGTGMGLGIVRALLRAHGGDIALGECEAGASFVLTLPAAEAGLA